MRGVAKLDARVQLLLGRGKCVLICFSNPIALQYSPKRIIPALAVNLSCVPSTEKFKKVCAIIPTFLFEESSTHWVKEIGAANTSLTPLFYDVLAYDMMDPISRFGLF